ncbi:translation initiation factor IF-3 C-terminal domain-containing protein [Cutibacterium avidum]|uniref:translation initiation factor IF-3 C-terminal domain-containing protein n=1 Tax=Cutibacterium avidum TaxID=33010 RepID=UPI000AEC1CD4|nr:translation initiation factor IF-3 C-terminal domain-containing protein [Cutibacterium avidum]
MKLRPKIDDHDYETKKGHAFLKAGDKVKITIIPWREHPVRSSASTCCVVLLTI